MQNYTRMLVGAEDIKPGQSKCGKQGKPGSHPQAVNQGLLLSIHYSVLLTPG